MTLIKVIKLVSSPVVNSVIFELTIIFEPIQQINIVAIYAENCITGEFNAIIFSAFEKPLYMKKRIIDMNETLRYSITVKSDKKRNVMLRIILWADSNKALGASYTNTFEISILQLIFFIFIQDICFFSF